MKDMNWLNITRVLHNLASTTLIHYCFYSFDFHIGSTPEIQSVSLVRKELIDL